MTVGLMEKPKERIEGDNESEREAQIPGHITYVLVCNRCFPF